jgi:hypothetical protein
MYESKNEVETILNELDDLVMQCIEGKLSFNDFLDKYGYPMGFYALDGHESDDLGKTILSNFSKRISLHEEITEQVLHQICTTEQAADPAYKNSSRIPPSEAFIIFIKLVAEHLPP